MMLTQTVKTKPCRPSSAYARRRINEIKFEPSTITCSGCHEHFADTLALDAHRRRGHQSQTSIAGACMPTPDMVASGFVITKKGRVWSLPTTTSKRVTPADQDLNYTCIECRKTFTDVKGFEAHQYLRVAGLKDRCLDSHELMALEFKHRKSGVWDRGLLTQVMPSQIRRLASVREPLF